MKTLTYFAERNSSKLSVLCMVTETHETLTETQERALFPVRIFGLRDAARFLDLRICCLLLASSMPFLWQ
jgi:hypothetical protein